MRVPRAFHNWLSLAGAVIAALSLFVFVFLFILHSIVDTSEAPYAGLVIFVLVPMFFISGLVLIAVGMLIEWRLQRAKGAVPARRFPIIDLNNKDERNATFIFAVGSVLLLLLVTLSSYKAYHVTDSVPFCGKLCHSVMQPEYTAYQNSPHARVRCVDCHVGPGADWFVKSKMSGLYQVYTVLLDKYPRPISVPIASLRPAQETCEQCHWPQQFFGAQQKRLTHFLPDKDNTRWDVNLLIRIGGGSPETGLTEGIHWHMNIANKVEYIATDRTRQHIPWVRMTNLDTGRATEYFSTENQLSNEEIAQAEIRTMDCMDCHNRPTHIFRSPSYSMNLALGTGKINPELPFIKQTGVKLLSENYESTELALKEIESGIKTFYQDNHSPLTDHKEDSISDAISEIQSIYKNNFFPDVMKVRWDIYPNNIGHLNFPGCYRCHDGLHRSADGKAITNTCTACHTIMSQGTPEDMEYSMKPDGLEFRHPEDIGEMWKEMKCSDCHTGELP